MQKQSTQLIRAVSVKKMIALLITTLMMMQMVVTPYSMDNVYAADDSKGSLTLDVGISDIPVTLHYGNETEIGKTGKAGKLEADKLYKYLSENLKWDVQDGTEGNESAAEIKELTVTYELNLPNAKSPEDRKEGGGLIEYKGAKGSFTIHYDKNGDWKKKTIQLDKPEKEDFLRGTLKMIPFGGATSTAKPVAGETVSLSNGKTMKTDSDGEFIFYGVSKSTTPDILVSTEATGKHTSRSDKMQDFSGTLYVKERPEIKASDFKIEGAYNGYVAEPKEDTVYKISGTGSNKVALERDGEGKDSVEVTLKKDGTASSFYVIKEGISSDKIENGIKVDTTAPDLKNIETEAVNEVKIKKHGIYSKKKADLLITVTVTDAESGLDKLQLVGKNADRTVYYETAKVTKDGAKTKASFVIESKEDLLKQVLYLTGVDKVGNKSKDILIRGSENASEITMEVIPPAIDDIRVTKGKINKNGWYKEPLTFEVTTKDLESGLSDVDVTTNNAFSLYSKNYEDKVVEAKTATFELSKETIEKEKNASGKYKILAKAVDNSGNITAKSIDVKVDLNAPVLSMSGVKKGAYLKKAPTLKLNEQEEYYKANGNYFTAIVTKDGKKHYSKTFSKVNNGTIPASVFSKDGNYKVTVSGEDAAGNKANIVKTNFVKDSTAPVIQLDGPNKNKYYNKAQTSRISIKERNYKTNTVHISVTRTLGKKTSKVTFPWRNTGVSSHASKKFSATGTYRISVYAVDKAGNRSKTKTARFTVDTVAPKLTISGVSNGKTYNYKDVVAPAISYSDDYLAGKKVSLTRAGREWYSKLGKSESSGRIKFADFMKKKANDGLYVLNVSVSDKAGNKTTKKIEFTVNRYGSSFKYGNAVKRLNGKHVKEVTDNLLISEYNVSKLKKCETEIRRDGDVINEDAKTTEVGKKDGYRVYNHLYSSDNFDEEGVYEVNVLSKDTAGNSMESKKENGIVKFTVDRTAPTLNVSGFEKINKADSVTLNISTSDSLSSKSTISATVDGRDVTPEKTDTGYTLLLSKGTNQHVSITVTDQAGNSKEFSETISVVPNGFIYFLLKYKLYIIFATVLIGIGIAMIIARKKSKNNADRQKNPSIRFRKQKKK